MKRFLALAVGMFFVVAFLGNADSQLPDFQIDTKSIIFSNPTPIEGEEITISVEVKNVGTGTPTMNEDLLVNLYEGDPATDPLQILCNDVILDLKAGKTGRVSAPWQPPVGKTDIYAVVNPTGDKHIKESNDTNNMAHAAIVATPKAFLPVTTEQIQASIDQGVAWIEAQQGKSSRTCLQMRH